MRVICGHRELEKSSNTNSRFGWKQQQLSCTDTYTYAWLTRPLKVHGFGQNGDQFSQSLQRNRREIIPPLSLHQRYYNRLIFPFDFDSSPRIVYIRRLKPFTNNLARNSFAWTLSLQSADHVQYLEKSQISWGRIRAPPPTFYSAPQFGSSTSHPSAPYNLVLRSWKLGMIRFESQEKARLDEMALILLILSVNPSLTGLRPDATEW